MPHPIHENKDQFLPVPIDDRSTPQQERPRIRLHSFQNHPYLFPGTDVTATLVDVAFVEVANIVVMAGVHVDVLDGIGAAVDAIR